MNPTLERKPPKDYVVEYLDYVPKGVTRTDLSVNSFEGHEQDITDELLSKLEKSLDIKFAKRLEDLARTLWEKLNSRMFLYKEIERQIVKCANARYVSTMSYTLCLDDYNWVGRNDPSDDELFSPENWKRK